MRTTTTLALALALAVGLASAQEAQQTIDMEMTAVAVMRIDEIEWAGDEPFSRETSTFDGRCSVPSDFMYRSLIEGLTFPTGPFTAECESCGQLVWEEDDDGRPVVRGLRSTDGIQTIRNADGSVTTMTYVQEETSFDPVMGVFTFDMRFDFQSMTGLEALGLDFVAGSARATFVAPDIVALLTESAPKIGVLIGRASFAPVATD